MNHGGAGGQHECPGPAAVLHDIGYSPAIAATGFHPWEPGTSARMRARYLHVPDAMLKDVARKIAEAIWGPSENPGVDKNQDNGG